MAVHEAKKIKSIPVEIKRVGTWDEPFYIVEWGKPVKWIVFGIFFLNCRMVTWNVFKMASQPQTIKCKMPPHCKINTPTFEKSSKLSQI